MKDIAAQLTRRAQPAYIKQRAKEAAVEKSMEWKDRITGSPLALGIIGGLVTAAVARTVLNQRRSRGYYTERRRFYAGEEPGFEEQGTIRERVEGMKEQVSDKVEGVKERAVELKDEAMEKVDRLRERVPSADEVKDKARELGTRARDYAVEEPLITALGSLAIGAALGFLLPMSEPERRLLAPAREQVGAKLESLSSQVSEKVQGKVDELHDQIAGEQGGTNPTGSNPAGDIKFPT